MRLHKYGLIELNKTREAESKEEIVFLISLSVNDVIGYVTLVTKINLPSSCISFQI